MKPIVLCSTHRRNSDGKIFELISYGSGLIGFGPVGSREIIHVCKQQFENDFTPCDPSETDDRLTITDLIQKAHAMAVEKGWWDGPERSIGDQVANFHAEISEAWEEVRAGRNLVSTYLEPDGKPCGVPIELADTLIRIFDTCGRYKIDLEQAIRIKMAFNATRPYRHGGKVA
jgi:NTP pyrophosphatase (non-canonical NTP hydrolase)